jgi:hypothetical protein
LENETALPLRSFDGGVFALITEKQTLEAGQSLNQPKTNPDKKNRVCLTHYLDRANVFQESENTLQN